MFSRLSLKYRIALVIFVLEAAMMTVVLWQTLSMSRQAAAEFHSATENVLLGLMQEIAIGALLTEEYGDLQLYVAKVATQPNVERLFVSDARGRVVAAAPAAQIGKPPPQMTDSEHRFWRTAPVGSAAGNLGALAIEFSTADMEAANQRALNWGAALAAVGMSAIAAVGILVGFVLTRRLGRVTAAAERFARGDTAARSGVMGGDEVGWLGQTFDQMVTVVTDQRTKLLEQTERVRLLLDSTAEAIYGVDLDGRCIFANPACLRILGYETEAQLLGQRIHDLIHHSFPDGQPYPRSKCRIANATRRGDSAHCDTEVFWRADRTSLPAEYWSHPIRKETQIVGHVVAFVDITERRQAEAELLRHRNHLEELVAQRTAEIRDQAEIIDQVREAVVTADMGANVTGWNKGAARLFGKGAEQALGRPLADLFPSEESILFREQILPALSASGGHEGDIRMRGTDGRVFFARLSLSLLRQGDGSAKGLVALAADITERKAAEAALRRLTEQLAAANKELESFSYSVSHDLRAPLRAIDGFSQALEEDHGERLDDAAKDYLRRVRRSAQNMGQLIDDLLELSRVTRRELTREDVDLSEMARSVMAELQESAPKRKAQVQIAPGMVVRGDAGLLHIAVLNLLGNAWKYTAYREVAEIVFGCRHDNGENVFFVQDNGAGFDMRYADHLFGAFQRLHRQEEFEGTGVGLATVQRVLARHGGRIWARAVPDRGATFYFVIPAGEDAGLMAAASTHEAAAS